MQNAEPKLALSIAPCECKLCFCFLYYINSEFLLKIQFTLQNENKCSSLHRCGMEV